MTLKTSLALFAKDHLNPADTVRLAKQQQEMRERYDLQYLAFDAQAWWWYWAVQMKAQLGALATPKEATRLQNLASQYDRTLQDCVTDLEGPWNKLLREKYDPANWGNRNYESLQEQMQAGLEKHGRERDALARDMSQVFASE